MPERNLLVRLSRDSRPHSQISLLIFALVFILSPASTLLLASDDLGATVGNAAADRSELIVTFAQRYCIDCHGEDAPEANVRLDQFGLRDVGIHTVQKLERIINVLRDERMPPEGSEIPTAQERVAMITELEKRLQGMTKEIRETSTWTRNRRMTVQEYNHTMQALFDVNARFNNLLPRDAVSESGYHNQSHLLGLSSIQIEAYLDSARRAVDRYVQIGSLVDDPVRYHIEFEDLFYSTADRYGTRKKAPTPIDLKTFDQFRTVNSEDSPNYVDALGPKLPGGYSDDEQLREAIPKLNQQFVAIPKRLRKGELIVRVKAAGTPDRDGRFPRMRVEAGITLGDGCSIDKRVLGEVDVTASIDRPETFEFRMRLEDIPSKGLLKDEDSFDKLSVFDMDQIFISNITADPKAVFDRGRGAYRDPQMGSKTISKQLKQMAEVRVCFLHLDCLEIEMFPGVGADNKEYRWRFDLDEQENDRQPDDVFLEEFVVRFMTEAYRRPVSQSEVSSKLELLTTLQAQGLSFEESLSETLSAVLVSPQFLFIESVSPPEEESAHSARAYKLASRLSYLLWMSPPDEQLLQRATDGSLTRPSVLRLQTERLLSDPRSRRFLKSFCRQWLRLDRFENVAVNRQSYPGYDEDLADLSIRETLAYFVEVFESDASALDLLKSDYVIVNDRLADHYDIAGVTTGDLKRIQLPEGSTRGGLLTQASLLTMNSNGVDSHPIRRGVWLLDRLLNSPPPPPPPNVPAVDENDPDFRGLSLKQQIELHRDQDSCRNCHEKIDPWGIPFENFDAIGRWREQYQQDSEHTDLHQMDVSTQLPDGTQIDGILSLKEYLREKQNEKFANALVHNLITYSIGRSPDFLDRPHVQNIQQRFADSDFRLRELILAIVESPLFFDPSPQQNGPR